MRGESPLKNLENLPFRKAKTTVQSASAGQLTEPRTIGELLLLSGKNVTDKNCSQGKLSHPQKLVKLRPWWRPTVIKVAP